MFMQNLIKASIEKPVPKYTNEKAVEKIFKIIKKPYSDKEKEKEKYKECIELLKCVKDTNVLDETFLYYACKYKESYNFIRELVEKRSAKINVRCEMNTTPLIYASLKGNYKVVKFLLAQGARIDSRDDEGMTALTWACFDKHYKIVSILLDYGADITKSSSSNSNCLHYCLYRTDKKEEQINILLLLLNHSKIEILKEQKNDDNESPIEGVHKKDRKTILKFFNFNPQEIVEEIKKRNLLDLKEEKEVEELLKERQDAFILTLKEKEEDFLIILEEKEKERIKERNKLLKKLKKRKDEIERKDSTIRTIRNEVMLLKNELSKFNKNEKIDIEEKLNEQKKELEKKFQNDINDILKERNEAQKILEGVKNEIKEKEEIITKRTKEVKEVENRLNIELKEKEDILAEKINQVKYLEKKMDTKKKDLKNRIEQLEKDKILLRDQLKKREKEVLKKKNKIHRLSVKLNNSNAYKEKFQKQLKEEKRKTREFKASFNLNRGGGGGSGSESGGGSSGDLFKSLTEKFSEDYKGKIETMESQHEFLQLSSSGNYKNQLKNAKKLKKEIKETITKIEEKINLENENLIKTMKKENENLKKEIAKLKKK